MIVMNVLPMKVLQFKNIFSKITVKWDLSVYSQMCLNVIRALIQLQV